MAKSDAFDRRPIQHGRRDGPGLRYKRDISPLGEGMRKTRIELQGRHLNAKAIRAYDAQEVRSRGIAHLLRETARHASGDNDGRAAALTPEPRRLFPEPSAEASPRRQGPARTAGHPPTNSKARRRTLECLGLTKQISPLNPARKRFSPTCSPIEPGRSLAPISATLLG